MQDVASEASFVAATLAAQAKHDMGLCSGRSDFEPALGLTHGLVIDLLKAELVDIEVEGFVLVADTHTDGADFREHVYLLFVDQSMFNDSLYRTKIQVYAEAKMASTKFTTKLENNYLNNYNKKCRRQVPGVSPLSFLGTCAYDFQARGVSFEMCKTSAGVKLWESEKGVPNETQRGQLRRRARDDGRELASDI